MCLVQSPQFNMLYIIDSDGTMSPDAVITLGPSTLLASDDDKLLTFLDTTKCTAVPSGCYQYCKDACFRSVRYDVTGPDQGNYTLKVCNRYDLSTCAFFKGGRRTNSGPHTYMAHLPVGLTYDSVFLDATATEITPTKTAVEYEPTFCSSDSLFEVKFVPTSYLTNAPNKAPINAPIAQAPNKAPTNAPIAQAPEKAPTNAPIAQAPDKTPTNAPISQPTNTPITTQINVPVEPPTTILIKVPSNVPVAAPVAAPTGTHFLRFLPSLFSSLRSMILSILGIKR
jgi:hypothetical protein